MKLYKRDYDPGRQDVIADNGESCHIANALYMWESGDFSEWAERAGFPLQIGKKTFRTWAGVEEALANFPRGPYDPTELEEI